MKLIYGGVPYNTTKVRHFEVNTNDATCEPTAVQAGLTYYANGKREVGTGKCFEFAIYGHSSSNTMIPLPNTINAIQIASTIYPIRQTMEFDIVRNADLTVNQIIGEIIKDGIEYPINIQVNNNILRLTCDIATDIQLFLGKDNYV